MSIWPVKSSCDSGRAAKGPDLDASGAAREKTGIGREVGSGAPSPQTGARVSDRPEAGWVERFVTANAPWSATAYFTAADG